MPNPYALDQIEPSPPASNNPFMLEAIAKDQETALRASLGASMRVNPEEAARANILASETGKPAAAIARNLPDFEHHTQLDAYSRMIADKPVTRRFLTVPQQAAVSHDDVSTLSSIEALMGSLGRAGRYVTSADDTGGLLRDVGAGVLRANRGAAGAFQAGAEFMAPAVQPLADMAGKTNPYTDMAGWFARAGAQSEATAKRLSPPSDGLVGNAVSSGVQSLTANLMALPMMLLPGGQGAAMTMLAGGQGGQSYQQAREQGVPMTQALPFAASQAAIEYATEKLPMHLLLKDLQAGTPIAKTLIHNMAAEIPGEQVATILQDLNEWAVLPENKGKPFSEYLKERPSAAAQTLIATMIGVGGQVSVMQAVQTAADNAQGIQRKANEAEQVGANVEALKAAADASKLRARDPATFQAFVDQVSENGQAPAELFINAETLANTLNQSGVTMEQLRAMSAAVADQLQAENIVPGSDVRVPVADLLKAPSELTATLIDHLRETPDAMSRAEAQEFLANQGDAIRRDVEQELSRRDAAAARDQQVAEVSKIFQAQLDTAAKFRPEVNKAYAELLGNFVVTQAERAGLTPQEFQQRYRLGVQATEPVGGQRLEQAAIESPEFKAWFADSKAVDAQGRPLRVYRGEERDNTDGRQGLWFTSDADAASAYAEDLSGGVERGGNVTPAFVSIQNPLTVDAGGARYDALQFEGAQHTTETLAALAADRGHDGLIVRDVRDGSSRPIDVYRPLRPEQVKSATGNRGTFDLADPNIVHQGARGALSFGADITQQPSLIALLERADLSTFIHESAHWFLEVQADLAARIVGRQADGDVLTKGEQQIVDDMGKLLEWFGIKGTPDQSALTAWLGMSLEERRAHHEDFARGFERYTMEGTAPSLGLQSAFQRFRSWLVSVYKTLAGLNVQLTDDVRAVFGRMLASEQAITEAESARAMGPLFQTPEQAGMTPEEFADYQALGARATDDAEAALDKRLMADMKWLSRARDRAIRARQAEVEGLRSDIRTEVSREVMSQPVYRAWQFLTGKGHPLDRLDGTVTTGRARSLDASRDNLFEAIGKLGGMNKAAVESQWGEQDKLASGVFGAPVLRREGLSIEAMAERLVELGYLMPGENGSADMARFEALFADQARGQDRYSIARDMNADDTPVQPIADPEMFNGKLNTGDLKERFGDDAGASWRALSARKMTSPTGLPVDVVAETFGYESGEALVRALVEAQPPRERVDALTDQRMLEQHGDIGSPEALSRAADEAVHSEVRARVIAAELKALARATKVRETSDSLYTGGTVDVMARAAREYAAGVIARQKLADLRPKQYAAAEARSARLAEKSLGNLAEAAMHKRNQLVNNFAAKAAYEAQEEIVKAETFFRRVLKGNAEDVSKSRDWAVVQAARAVLGQFGIGTKGDAATTYLNTLAANDPAMHGVLADRMAQITANAKPAAQLTVEEFRGLVEQVRGLWHLAQRSRQIEIDGKMVDRAVVQGELQARLVAIGIPERVAGEGQAVTDAERRLSRLQTLGAALRRVESWAGAKDGSKGIGPFRRYIFQPVKEAADRYRADRATYIKQYKALLETLDLGKARIESPELGYTFGYSRGGSGKAEILHAILHTGNASNKRKLLLGRGWAVENETTGELDTSRWDAFVQRMQREGVLTKKDYDFAQGVWDLLESTKSLAQRAHRDVFGYHFSEVTADAFENQFGKYRGGYVPAMMDPEVVKDAATRALQEDENQTLAYAFPSTSKGFTKSRVEYNRPLLLDLRTLSTHIDKVLLFSHMEAPVRDVRRVLASREVSEPLHRIDPAAFDGLLTPWLNRAARQTVETRVPGDNGLMRFFSKARQRAGLAAMFANVSNTAQQITGFSIASLKVRPKYLLDGIAGYLIAPRQTARTVAEASIYMANRMDSEVASMTDAINDILLNPSVYERAQSWTARHAYFMQSAVDNVMGPIIWTGAYNQALEQGHSTADAVRLADSAVRETQGSTLAEDVSRIETGNAFVRMFTQFAGYFNMQANLLGTEFANVMHEQGLRKGMGRGLYVFALGFLVPNMLAELIAQAFKGGPDDEDKDGSTLDDWLMSVVIMGNVKAGLAMVPGIGQAANALINTLNKKPYDDRISTSPAVSMIESAVKAPSSVYNAVAGEGRARTAVRDLATLISMTTGLPATAIARPIGYLAGVAEERISPTGPGDAVRGFITGVPSPESKQ